MVDDPVFLVETNHPHKCPYVPHRQECPKTKKKKSEEKFLFFLSFGRRMRRRYHY